MSLEKIMNNVDCLKINMRAEALSGWNYLLQKGFFLQGRAGMSVREFLRETLAWDDSLIDSEVRTVFLNNSPVDDIDAVHIKAGDRMALGSAMPGIVGICMGRDNPYKEFRRDISIAENSADESSALVSVFTKIFSTLAVYTGEGVLKRGVTVNAGQLAELLEGRMELVREVVGMDLGELIPRLQAEEGDVLVAVEFS
ncbi:MAG: hypothetical protein JEY79_05230 [Pseudodesulfovibrio sp.]|nr:hypothetical protein [Pseudodesulfovibrio sp.]